MSTAHIDAIETIVSVFNGIDSESTWGSMTCAEINDLAEALTSVGHKETADSIIGWHSMGDDEGDSHFRDEESYGHQCAACENGETTPDVQCWGCVADECHTPCCDCECHA